LKIGDFGMASPWPAPPGLECEGDREYIGPEILMGLYDKHSDIFSLGLIMLEIAGNVELPDNGPTWQKLRSGDLSDVPSLTSSAGSSMTRDAAGDTPMDSDDDAVTYDKSPSRRRQQQSFDAQNLGAHNASDLFGQLIRGELRVAPTFMVDSTHDGALDSIVKWMISPDPDKRPTADKILETEGVQWAVDRRRSGATIFEGIWGPSEKRAVDSEMIDV